jgi:predicted phosphodiesterase
VENGIGILSDAHGNGAAFEKAIQVLRDLGAARFVFLGDALGYIASTSVLDSIRELGEEIICLLGNHEQAILSGDLGGPSEAVYQHDAISDMLSNRDRGEISEWHISHVEEYFDTSALFVHGTEENPVRGYLYSDSYILAPDSPHDFVFMGNTHRPFIRRELGTTYVNVGSCGLPRDHGHYGSAGLFWPTHKRAVVYRFDIRQETHISLSLAPQPHATVLDLFARTTETMFGEVV